MPTDSPATPDPISPAFDYVFGHPEVITGHCLLASVGAKRNNRIRRHSDCPYTAENCACKCHTASRPSLTRDRT